MYNIEFFFKYPPAAVKDGIVPVMNVFEFVETYFPQT